MSTFLRFLFTGMFAASFLLLQSCFPTKPDNEKRDNPTDPDTSVITDDPGDLPIDVDANFVLGANSIDSLFEVLVQRVESLESAETPDDVFNTDFISLRRSFAAALSSKPSHAKANVGYIVSAVCALNTSSAIKKMVDSIDAYIKAYDEYYYSESDFYAEESPQYLLAKRQRPNRPLALQRASSTELPSSTTNANIFGRQGIEGLGRILIAQTPKILLAQTQKPSFPGFLTVSFIQQMVEDDIIPRLNEIVSACRRLEESDISLVLTAFDETVELDVGDIYLFEAGMRLARAGLGYFTAYDMDIRSPNGSNSMQWINDLSNMEEYTVRQTYRLKEDTLISLRVYIDTAFSGKMSDVVQYNLKRSGFLNLRRINHASVYTDLKKVPELIKTGLAFMKNETDNQEDDLIAAGNIFDIDADMADFSSELLSDGFTPALANRFKSPESLMDFITEILTEEYPFNETIDGYNISMTVNLSKWFTNPVDDLKTLFPKYRLALGKDRYVSSKYIGYSDSWSDNTIYANPGDIIDIPSTLITGDETDEWGNRTITLSQDYSVEMYIDSTISCTPVILTDDAGNDIPRELMEDMYDDKEALQICFPYFNDYTVNGLFPLMTTRSSWIDFLSQFYD